MKSHADAPETAFRGKEKTFRRMDIVFFGEGE
jgi:hypothetical protein